MNSLWNIPKSSQTYSAAGEFINGEGILVKAHKNLKIL